MKLSSILVSSLKFLLSIFVVVLVAGCSVSSGPATAEIDKGANWALSGMIDWNHTRSPTTTPNGEVTEWRSFTISRLIAWCIQFFTSANRARAEGGHRGFRKLTRAQTNSMMVNFIILRGLSR
jgi:hypothetical protein